MSDYKDPPWKGEKPLDNVQRYSPSNRYELLNEDSYGDYVDYCDYNSLQTENDKLIKQNNYYKERLRYLAHESNGWKQSEGACSDQFDKLLAENAKLREAMIKAEEQDDILIARLILREALSQKDEADE